MSAASFSRTRCGRAGWRVQSADLGALPEGGSIPLEDLNDCGAPGRREPFGAAAKLLEFELAAALRDQIIELRGK